VTAHPGVAHTNLGTQGHGVSNRLSRVGLPFNRGSASGALPLLHAATDPTVAGGQFYRPAWGAFGYPVLETSSGPARDGATAGALWRASVELTGLDPTFVRWRLWLTSVKAVCSCPCAAGMRADVHQEPSGRTSTRRPRPGQQNRDRHRRPWRRGDRYRHPECEKQMWPRTSEGLARCHLAAACRGPRIARVCQSTGWPNTPESALLRNTAAGISTLFALLFVMPILVRFLPTSWSDPAHVLVGPD
jgi:hypothetical protein